MDKYEEFKKWFIELKKVPKKVKMMDDFPFSTPVPPAFVTLEVNKERLFELFEEEYGKRQKERKVKDILDKYIPEMKICGVDMEEEIQLNGTVDECYNELKEEDLLK